MSIDDPQDVRRGEQRGAQGGRESSKEGEQMHAVQQVLMLHKTQMKMLGQCFTQCVPEMRAELKNAEKSCI